MNDMTIGRHHIIRVRQEARRRLIKVASVKQVTPGMRRIGFASADLHDFESLSPDDHVKLFLPTGGEPCRRDYTPRAFDATAGSLTIDFALHASGDAVGPATAWARAARIGDEIEIGGPRGSVVVPDDFDWYLLIGDETALPAMGRRVETLRPGVPVKTIAVVDSPAERQAFAGSAAWEGVWISRDRENDDAALLLSALKAQGPLPQGDGYIWIAAEAEVARALRTYVEVTLRHPKAWLKASGYWTIGQSDKHGGLANVARRALGWLARFAS